MNSLVEMADRFNLNRVWLDVHMPAEKEGYRGSWQRPTVARHDELWRVDMPLFCGARMVGRLSIEGEHGGLSVCQLIELLMGVVQPFEERLAAIASKTSPGGPVAAVESSNVASGSAASAEPDADPTQVVAPV